MWQEYLFFYYFFYLQKKYKLYSSLLGKSAVMYVVQSSLIPNFSWQEINEEEKHIIKLRDQL